MADKLNWGIDKDVFAEALKELSSELDDKLSSRIVEHDSFKLTGTIDVTTNIDTSEATKKVQALSDNIKEVKKEASELSDIEKLYENAKGASDTKRPMNDRYNDFNKFQNLINSFGDKFNDIVKSFNEPLVLLGKEITDLLSAVLATNNFITEMNLTFSEGSSKRNSKGRGALYDVSREKYNESAGRYKSNMKMAINNKDINEYVNNAIYYAVANGISKSSDLVIDKEKLAESVISNINVFGALDVFDEKTLTNELIRAMDSNKKNGGTFSGIANIEKNLTLEVVSRLRSESSSYQSTDELRSIIEETSKKINSALIDLTNIENSKTLVKLVALLKKSNGVGALSELSQGVQLAVKNAEKVIGEYTEFTPDVMKTNIFKKLQDAVSEFTSYKMPTTDSWSTQDIELAKQAVSTFFTIANEVSDFSSFASLKSSGYFGKAMGSQKYLNTILDRLEKLVDRPELQDMFGQNTNIMQSFMQLIVKGQAPNSATVKLVDKIKPRIDYLSTSKIVSSSAPVGISDAEVENTENNAKRIEKIFQRIGAVYQSKFGKKYSPRGGMSLLGDMSEFDKMSDAQVESYLKLLENTEMTDRNFTKNAQSYRGAFSSGDLSAILLITKSARDAIDEQISKVNAMLSAEASTFDDYELFLRHFMETQGELDKLNKMMSNYKNDYGVDYSPAVGIKDDGNQRLMNLVGRGVENTEADKIFRLLTSLRLEFETLVKDYDEMVNNSSIDGNEKIQKSIEYNDKRIELITEISSALNRFTEQFGSEIKFALSDGIFSANSKPINVNSQNEIDEYIRRVSQRNQQLDYTSRLDENRDILGREQKGNNLGKLIQRANDINIDFEQDDINDFIELFESIQTAMNELKQIGMLSFEVDGKKFSIAHMQSTLNSLRNIIQNKGWQKSETDSENQGDNSDENGSGDNGGGDGNGNGGNGASLDEIKQALEPTNALIQNVNDSVGQLNTDLNSGFGNISEALSNISSSEQTTSVEFDYEKLADLIEKLANINAENDEASTDSNKVDIDKIMDYAKQRFDTLLRTNPDVQSGRVNSLMQQIMTDTVSQNLDNMIPILSQDLNLLNEFVIGLKKLRTPFSIFGMQNAVLNGGSIEELQNAIKSQYDIVVDSLNKSEAKEMYIASHISEVLFKAINKQNDVGMNKGHSEAHTRKQLLASGINPDDYTVKNLKKFFEICREELPKGVEGIDKIFEGSVPTILKNINELTEYVTNGVFRAEDNKLNVSIINLLSDIRTSRAKIDERKERDNKRQELASQLQQHGYAPNEKGEYVINLYDLEKLPDEIKNQLKPYWAKTRRGFSGLEYAKLDDTVETGINTTQANADDTPDTVTEIKTLLQGLVDNGISLSEGTINGLIELLKSDDSNSENIITQVINAIKAEFPNINGNQEFINKISTFIDNYDNTKSNPEVDAKLDKIIQVFEQTQSVTETVNETTDVDTNGVYVPLGDIEDVADKLTIESILNKLLDYGATNISLKEIINLLKQSQTSEEGSIRTPIETYEGQVPYTQKEILHMLEQQFVNPDNYGNNYGTLGNEVERENILLQNLKRIFEFLSNEYNEESSGAYDLDENLTQEGDLKLSVQKKVDDMEIIVDALDELVSRIDEALEINEQTSNVSEIAEEYQNALDSIYKTLDDAMMSTEKLHSFTMGDKYVLDFKSEIINIISSLPQYIKDLIDSNTLLNRKYFPSFEGEIISANDLDESKSTKKNITIDIGYLRDFIDMINDLQEKYNATQNNPSDNEVISAENIESNSVNSEKSYINLTQYLNGIITNIIDAITEVKQLIENKSFSIQDDKKDSDELVKLQEHIEEKLNSVQSEVITNSNANKDSIIDSVDSIKDEIKLIDYTDIINKSMESLESIENSTDEISDKITAKKLDEEYKDNNLGINNTNELLENIYNLIIKQYKGKEYKTLSDSFIDGTAVYADNTLSDGVKRMVLSMSQDKNFYIGDIAKALQEGNIDEAKTIIASTGRFLGEFEGKINSSYTNFNKNVDKVKEFSEEIKKHGKKNVLGGGDFVKQSYDIANKLRNNEAHFQIEDQIGYFNPRSSSGKPVSLEETYGMLERIRYIMEGMGHYDTMDYKGISNGLKMLSKLWNERGYDTNSLDYLKELFSAPELYHNNDIKNNYKTREEFGISYWGKYNHFTNDEYEHKKSNYIEGLSEVYNFMSSHNRKDDEDSYVKAYNPVLAITGELNFETYFQSVASYLLAINTNNINETNLIIEKLDNIISNLPSTDGLSEALNKDIDYSSITNPIIEKLNAIITHLSAIDRFGEAYNKHDALIDLKNYKEDIEELRRILEESGRKRTNGMMGFDLNPNKDIGYDLWHYLAKFEEPRLTHLEQGVPLLREAIENILGNTGGTRSVYEWDLKKQDGGKDRLFVNFDEIDKFYDAVVLAMNKIENTPNYNELYHTSGYLQEDGNTIWDINKAIDSLEESVDALPEAIKKQFGDIDLSSSLTTTINDISASLNNIEKALGVSISTGSTNPDDLVVNEGKKNDDLNEVVTKLNADEKSGTSPIGATVDAQTKDDIHSIAKDMALEVSDNATAKTETVHGMDYEDSRNRKGEITKRRYFNDESYEVLTDYDYDAIHDDELYDENKFYIPNVAHLVETTRKAMADGEITLKSYVQLIRKFFKLLKDERFDGLVEGLVEQSKSEHGEIHGRALDSNGNSIFGDSWGVEDIYGEADENGEHNYYVWYNLAYEDGNPLNKKSNIKYPLKINDYGKLGSLRYGVGRYDLVDGAIQEDYYGGFGRLESLKVISDNNGQSVWEDGLKLWSSRFFNGVESLVDLNEVFNLVKETSGQILSLLSTEPQAIQTEEPIPEEPPVQTDNTLSGIISLNTQALNDNTEQLRLLNQSGIVISNEDFDEDTSVEGAMNLIDQIKAGIKDSMVKSEVLGFHDLAVVIQDEVIPMIEAKNAAIESEKTLVDSSVDSEISKFRELASVIEDSVQTALNSKQSMLDDDKSDFETVIDAQIKKVREFAELIRSITEVSAMDNNSGSAMLVIKEFALTKNVDDSYIQGVQKHLDALNEQWNTGNIIEYRKELQALFMLLSEHQKINRGGKLPLDITDAIAELEGLLKTARSSNLVTPEQFKKMKRREGSLKNLRSLYGSSFHVSKQGGAYSGNEILTGGEVLDQFNLDLFNTGEHEVFEVILYLEQMLSKFKELRDEYTKGYTEIGLILTNENSALSINADEWGLNELESRLNKAINKKRSATFSFDEILADDNWGDDNENDIIRTSPEEFEAYINGTKTVENAFDALQAKLSDSGVKTTILDIFSALNLQIDAISQKINGFDFATTAQKIEAVTTQVQRISDILSGFDKTWVIPKITQNIKDGDIEKLNNLTKALFDLEMNKPTDFTLPDVTLTISDETISTLIQSISNAIAENEFVIKKIKVAENVDIAHKVQLRLNSEDSIELTKFVAAPSKGSNLSAMISQAISEQSAIKLSNFEIDNTIAEGQVSLNQKVANAINKVPIEITNWKINSIKELFKTLINEGGLKSILNKISKQLLETPINLKSWSVSKLSEVRTAINNYLKENPVKITDIKVGLLTKTKSAILEAFKTIELKFDKDTVLDLPYLNVKKVLMSEDVINKIKPIDVTLNPTNLADIIALLSTATLQGVGNGIKLPNLNSYNAQEQGLTKIKGLLDDVSKAAEEYLTKINGVTDALAQVFELSKPVLAQINAQIKELVTGMRLVQGGGSAPSEPTNLELYYQDLIKNAEKAQQKMQSGNTNVHTLGYIASMNDEYTKLIELLKQARDNGDQFDAKLSSDLLTQRGIVKSMEKSYIEMEKAAANAELSLKQADLREQEALQSGQLSPYNDEQKTIIENLRNAINQSRSNISYSNIESMMSVLGGAMSLFDENVDTERFGVEQLEMLGKEIIVDYSDPEKYVKAYTEAAMEVKNQLEDANSNLMKALSDPQRISLSGQYREFADKLTNIFTGETELNEESDKDISELYNQIMIAFNKSVGKGKVPNANGGQKTGFIDISRMNKAKKEVQTLVNQLKKYQNSQSTEYQTQLQSYVPRIDDYIGKAQDIKDETAEDSINLKNDIEKMMTDFDTLVGRKPDDNGVYSFINKSKDDSNSQSLNRKFDELIAKIKVYGINNSKIFNDKESKNLFNNLLESANSIPKTDRTTNDLDRLTTLFSQLKLTISTKGLTGRSLGDEIKYIGERIGIKAVLGNSIYKVVNYFRQMINNVVELDTGMTALKRVTNETLEAYDKFLSGTSKRAQELGASMSEVVNLTTSFSKLGYNMEDAQVLAGNAIIYKTVGDLDINTLTNDMISAMKAKDCLNIWKHIYRIHLISGKA